MTEEEAKIIKFLKGSEFLREGRAVQWEPFRYVVVAGALFLAMILSQWAF